MADSRKKKSKENQNEGSDVEDGGDDEIIYSRNQDTKERLEVRRGYRTLLEDLQKNKEEYINPQSESLNEALQGANELNTKVKAPREGALDSATILMISNLGRQKVEALKTDFIKFEPVEFAEKLKTVVRGGVTQQERDAPITSQEWIRLGEAVQKFFKKSPSFHYMSGAFEPGERQQRPNKPKHRQVDKNQNEKATVVDKMKNFEEDNKNEATTAEVERVLETLKKCYRLSENNAVCYFEFVLNPHSFGQTVENMFYASFLVRDGLAKISLDDDQLPVIAIISTEPVKEKEEDQQASRKKKSNHQTVISITPEEWKDLVSAYKISKPLIPTRKSDVSEPDGKRSKKS
ncbi:hypothetical protein FSP39_008802 [Pinctada imbricata]|uniref:Non-structural maintenance of chromosomes element 4 n=1 Tax=Pinctada imbricata TaxID=66713 RepID=A0AA88XZE7_PINIB|nr:hypothetical protein FSP39_008802 [Pinctada imbricata]